MGIHFQEIFSAALWLAKFKAGEETLKIQDLIMEKLLLVLLPILICFAVYAYVGEANCGASKNRYFLEGTTLAGLPAEGDSEGTECKNACMASAQCKGYHVTIKAVSRSISKSSCTYYSKVTAWKRMSNLRARAFSYEKC